MTSSGDQDLYPDSCCTLKYPGCGQQAMATLSSDFANTFSDMLFTEGCLTVLRWKSFQNNQEDSKFLQPESG